MIAALALGLAVPFAAACGEEKKGLIGANRAADMQEHLDRIDELVAGGRCEGVTDRLRALRAEIEDLPRSTDPDLRSRLEEGVGNLETQAPEECRDQSTTETQPPETTEETVPEETVPEETVPEETTPPETTPPETTPPETTPPDTEEPTTPGEGATPPGQGGTPPGQQDSGGEEAPQAGVVLL
jgi:hypothetical protein